MALMSAANELCKLQYETLHVNIGIITNTTQGSIKTFCINNPDCYVYHEDDSRTVTAVDAGIGFVLSDLDNDAPPAVLGFLLKGVDAAELVGVELVTNSIKSVAMSAPATALGTVVFKGAAGATGAVTKNGTSGDPTGVTASYNLAFTAAFTSLNIDEDDATAINNTFTLRIVFRKRGV
jgi:hypothetical protein